MLRARLAFLTLAGSLFLTGCGTSSGFRPFARCHHEPCCGQLASNCGSVVGSTCGCETAGTLSTFDSGPMLVPPDATIMPPPPGSTAPVPRIVPVPQAAPTPYSPTGLRKLFSRDRTEAAGIVEIR